MPEGASMSGHVDQLMRKIKDDGQSQAVADVFRRYYERMRSGETGLIYERDISPLKPDSLPTIADMDAYAERGRRSLAHAAVLKLNGGLGTSMGLEGPKCMLEAKSGLTFLDISIKQTLALRAESGASLPLVLMNSFNTNQQTLQRLSSYPSSESATLATFIQNRFPKVLEENLAPAPCPGNPHLEWAPPGHGDIYLSLWTSGMLDSLLSTGVKYLFVSNIDNLGATLDLRLLGYFADNEIPFMMEVVERTPMDRKGGHIARRTDGQLILREIAQTAPEELDRFQDVERYHYFNSNNIWINLERLRTKLDKNNGMLHLPLICNRKTVNPRDPRSPGAIQLETAMGAAIAEFPGARAALVDHDRYRPVKRTDDLLLLWSDCYDLTGTFCISECEQCAQNAPVIELDPAYYGKFDDLKKRFAHGAPSLRACKKLTVQGDVYFGAGVRIEGAVTVRNSAAVPAHIDQNTVIGQDLVW